MMSSLLMVLSELPKHSKHRLQAGAPGEARHDNLKSLGENIIQLLTFIYKHLDIYRSRKAYIVQKIPQMKIS